MNYQLKVGYYKRPIDSEFVIDNLWATDNLLEESDCRYFDIDEVAKAVCQFEKYRKKALEDNDVGAKYSVELFLQKYTYERCSMYEFSRVAPAIKECPLASYSLTKEFDNDAFGQDLKLQLQKAFKKKKHFFRKDEGKCEFYFDNLDNLSDFLDKK